MSMHRRDACATGGWFTRDPLRLTAFGTSPAGAGEAAGCEAEEGGGGFAGGFGVFFGFGFVFEQVGHAGQGQGFGFGLHEFAAGAGDGLDGAFGDVELLGVDDVVELGEGDLVEVAEVEDADGWVEEVLEEGVGEAGKRGISGEGLGIWIGRETPSVDFVDTLLVPPLGDL
ncbi:MAG: hypothetical protein ACX94C_08530 [Phycisphaerales bacterium]